MTKSLSTFVFAAGKLVFALYWPPVLVALLAAPILAGTASAQVDAAREFRDDLFPPDLILREAEPLGLTDQQRDAVTALVKEMKQSFTKGQPKLHDATENLGQSLKDSSISEPAALDKFAAVLEAEKDIKRAQFIMLIRAKNLLTSGQQDKLRAIVKSQPPKYAGGGKQSPPTESSRPDARQELNARMQKVQAGVERWRQEGRDPAPILELMKTFGDQMQAGQFPAAKETLQRAQGRLDEPKLR